MRSQGGLVVVLCLNYHDLYTSMSQSQSLPLSNVTPVT